jgi:hypothetical protein
MNLKLDQAATRRYRKTLPIKLQQANFVCHAPSSIWIPAAKQRYVLKNQALSCHGSDMITLQIVTLLISCLILVIRMHELKVDLAATIRYRKTLPFLLQQARLVW